MQHKTAYRLAFFLAVLATLFILWINLAVGIIGVPENPLNLMYVGVPVIGIIGSVIMRFKANKMIKVMFAVAIAQALVGAITVLTGIGYPPTPLLSFIIFNGILIAFWLGSGRLFKKAAKEQTG